MDINKMIEIATLEKDKVAIETYRAVKAEILKNKTSKKPKPAGKNLLLLKFLCKDGSEFNTHVTELEVNLISNLVKQRKESMEIYKKNGRMDLFRAEEKQLQILEMMLPKPPTEEELQAYINAYYPDGTSSTVIKEIKAAFPTADDKLIYKLVKQNEKDINSL